MLQEPSTYTFVWESTQMSHTQIWDGEGCGTPRGGALVVNNSFPQEREK